MSNKMKKWIPFTVYYIIETFRGALFDWWYKHYTRSGSESTCEYKHM